MVPSGATKCFGHPFFGFGRGFEVGEIGVFREGFRQGIDQAMERCEVVLIAGLDGLFDAVIARDANGVGVLHGGESPLGLGQFRPAIQPCFAGGFFRPVGEKFRFGFPGRDPGEVAEKEREIDLLRAHLRECRFDERG